MFKKVRTRFAPSPTGYMHVGNLRTALYAYLLAKKNDGDFILRIEDTDRERTVDGAIDIIYSTLKKAGINWDEGPDIGGNFGPYIQSERMSFFKDYALQLVEKGHAYYCFCDKERLDELKDLQKASGTPPKYDGHCRNLSPEEIKKNLEAGLPYVIRQKMPREGSTTFNDEVFGEITFENSDLDDQILIKSDGMPTYNFANVVDDHLMEISHVIRGSEYLSSTPKYNLLYEAFGWDKPVYIHCSPVMKNATEKLSKRNGDATFEDLLAKGYLPQAIVNYIALLGWSPKGEEEIFSLNELIDTFDISGISKSPAIFDLPKLTAINAKYIRNMSDEEFWNHAQPYVKSVCKKEVNKTLLSQMLKTRTEIFKNIPEQIDFIDNLPEYSSDLYVHKKMKTNEENSLEVLKQILPVLEQLEDWNQNSIHDVMFKLIETLGLKNGRVLWPLRVALSGKSFTPGGGIELAALLGKDESIFRIKKGIEKLESHLNHD